MPTSFGPAIPGLHVYPQEFTEMVSPKPLGLIGCIHGPPEDPPDNAQLAAVRRLPPGVPYMRPRSSIASTTMLVPIAINRMSAATRTKRCPRGGVPSLTITAGGTS